MRYERYSQLISMSPANHILDTLGIMGTLKVDDRRLQKDLFEEERNTVELLELGPLHFDEIVRRIKKDSKIVGSLLSLLELKGIIKNSPSGTYSL